MDNGMNNGEFIMENFKWIIDNKNAKFFMKTID